MKFKNDSDLSQSLQSQIRFKNPHRIPTVPMHGNSSQSPYPSHTHTHGNSHTHGSPDFHNTSVGIQKFASYSITGFQLSISPMFASPTLRCLDKSVCRESARNTHRESVHASKLSNFRMRGVTRAWL